MSTFKKTKVVMLTTNEKATVGSIVTRPSDNRMATVNVLTKDDTQPCIHQHLYFLSDEEIKEGDWVYNGTEIWQVKSYYGFQPITKKIIATTDKSLFTETKAIGYTEDRARVFYGKEYLPQPSTLFIEKFVEEYNKGNQITEVLVEYEVDDGYMEVKSYLKVNSKDNTITIRKAKDSWSREEVKQLFDKMFATDIIDANVKKVDFDKWIEENL